MSDGLPHDLSSELPSPRDDEPVSLRQDILDELADHLACSLQRERVKTVSEQQARSNVLNRFGNPASIARKLWFDAMREKIMTQRLTLIVTCLCFVIVSAISLLTWQALERSRADQAAALLRQQEFFSKILARMQQNPPPRAPDGWSSLDVVLHSSSGAPVQGMVRVVESGRMPSPGNFREEVAKVTQPTGNDGVARMGMLPWGEHSLRIEIPSLNIWRYQRVYLRPGESDPVEIVCPIKIPVSQLKCEFETPDEIHNLPVFFRVRVTSEYVDDSGQSMTDRNGKWIIERNNEISLLVNSQGKILGSVKQYGGPVARQDQAIEIRWADAEPVAIVGNELTFSFNNEVLFLADGEKSPPEEFSPDENGIKTARFYVGLQQMERSSPTRILWPSAGIQQVSIANQDAWQAFRISALKLQEDFLKRQTFNVELTFLHDDPQRSPAPGVKLFQKNLPKQLTSDAQGVINLTLDGTRSKLEGELWMPWLERTQVAWTFSPGEASKKTIVVPTGPPKRGHLSVYVNAPEEITARGPLVYQLVLRAHQKIIDGQGWEPTPNPIIILTSPSGELQHVTSRQNAGESLDHGFQNLGLKPLDGLPAGDYTVVSVTVCRKGTSTFLRSGNDENMVRVKLLSGAVEPPPDQAKLNIPADGTAAHLVLTLPSDIWQGMMQDEKGQGGGFF